jgi:hypothetical protein
MSTFTAPQQRKCRFEFIEECRQKAWGAACHADWIGKQLDTVMAQYEKLKAEDAKLGEDIKTAETALDSHTYDNRQKRKELQERREGLRRTMGGLAQNMAEGQKAMQQLYANAEQNLTLAEHAKEWAWKEVEASEDSAIHEPDQAEGQENSG